MVGPGRDWGDRRQEAANPSQPIFSTGFFSAYAAAWVAFHLFGVGLYLVGGHYLRAIHLGGAVILILAGRPLSKPFRLVDHLLMVITTIAIGYLLVFHEQIVLSNWYTNIWAERILGLGLFFCLLEAIRRALGRIFVGLVAFFVGYAIAGPYIPGLLGHQGVGLDRLIFSFYLGNQGVFGTLIGISASVVALFLIFGELLKAGGAGDTFINIAMRIGGRLKGGAGMVAVIGSAFMGMINGSAVANVTSTGVLTIPLMRRMGFNRNLAGGVEAVASTGGQFMPPIMGPGAFLLAEILGIAYLDVAVAALIPSSLFFVGLLFSVWLFADRDGLSPIPPDLIPSRAVTYAPAALLGLALPLGVLIALVVMRYTVQYAVFWSSMMALAIIATTTLAMWPKSEKFSWARVSDLGHTMTAVSKRSADSIAYVGMIIAAAQMVVAIINLTGLGVVFSQLIVGIGQDSAALSLVLTMLVAILLGMGMPTPAAYAVAAAVLGPPLAKLGYELLPAHLFIYYFACLASITPPIASAIFAAISISSGQVIPTARYALILSLSLFIIPYFFIDDPLLLMIGSYPEILLSTFTAGVGIATLSLATIGYFKHRIHPFSRLVFAAAAISMMVPEHISDAVGFIVMAVTLFVHLRALNDLRALTDWGRRGHDV
jgi:TRAP transporter 4TM/12TM fusion protein